MILAHLADLHLGFRAYHRLATGGMNARERDVALAFRACIDRLIELHVDLVLVAGDVFHTVRPSNSAVTDAFRQFARLSATLPGVPIVVIAGNHDSPRAVETGSILRLLAEIPNIVVVDEDAQTVYLEPIDTSVLCLPHNALSAGERVAMEPDRAAGTNILMLHGTIIGGGAEQKLRYVSEYGGVVVETSEIRPERWDYVALGHYHLTTEIAPNMWYPGGIERTSTNIWEEKGEKGFLTFDTDAGRATFHRLPGRDVVDLPRISARGLSAAEIDASIRQRVESIRGGVAGRIVRLVIEDIARDCFRELDHRRIREYRAEALHFHLDARRPELRRLTPSGSPGRRRTLEEEVENFLRSDWEASTPGIRTDHLVQLAQRYLAEASRGEPQDALFAAAEMGEVSTDLDAAADDGGAR